MASVAFTTLVLSSCMVSENKKSYIGDIHLPIKWGNEYLFDYKARHEGVRLRLHIVKKSNQRNIPESVRNDCRKKAEQITKPEPVVLSRNKKKESELNNDLYDQSGGLTTWGKLSLQQTRDRAASRCVDSYWYGNTQFSITNSRGDEFIGFHIAKQGMGSIKRPVRQSKKEVGSEEEIEIRVFPTENDDQLITESNTQDEYSLYIEEFKPPKVD